MDHQEPFTIALPAWGRDLFGWITPPEQGTDYGSIALKAELLFYAR
jgi:hypothetical protein